MRKKGYKRYPVVKDGRVVGMLSQTVLIDYFKEKRKRFVLKYLNKEQRKEYPI